MIKSFINFIFYEKRYSPTTIAAYKNDLIQFQAFLSATYELAHPEQANFNMLRSWIVHLREENYSARSINRKIATLKSFYKFLSRKGIIQKNPSQRIRSLKLDRRTPVFLEEHKIIALLDGFEFSEDFPGLRSKLILEMLYATGIRLSELIQLSWADIDFSKKLIRVVGKGSKERWIPITDQLLQLIKRYELHKRQFFEGSPISSKLILTDAGAPAYPMLVYKTVKQYLSQITTQDQKSPHVLRHSFATHLLNKGADLNAIKELLGHSSLNATQVYTHNSLSKLKEVFDQAHPKA
ncbi:MAG: tyrosine-type recombinase/integrase [Bacteroidota bacterium]